MIRQFNRTALTLRSSKNSRGSHDWGGGVCPQDWPRLVIFGATPRLGPATPSGNAYRSLPERPRLRRVLATVFVTLCCVLPAMADEPLRIATFNVDATPPIGSPVAYVPARSIIDPLSARGLVLLSNEQPVVVCAVDWIGIGNGGHDAWREQIARAAGTTADRVAVHTLHQHDGVRCDFDTEQLMQEHGLGGRRFNEPFSRDALARVAQAIRKSLKEPKKVSHIGTGMAKVEKVASNRRLLGPDGKVRLMRYSASTNSEAIAAPEGVIDPNIRLISFWNDETPLAVISYYATHPQSYYGKGDVTAEFVGMARAEREQDLPEAVHVHFNGAGGNIAAGKYNDGSPERRPILAGRLAQGMKLAWEATRKKPITTGDLSWRVERVKLPPADFLNETELLKTLSGEDNAAKVRFAAAIKLTWLRRCLAEHEIEIGRLRLGSVDIVHMPGELFVEYQLAAQVLRPDAFVCMAAYGDYGPGYIGTEIAYSQGGYETSERASLVAPSVEGVLMNALRELLK